MEKYEKFARMVNEVGEEFRKISHEETIRLVSHLDADGITSCSLMVKLLNLTNRKYSLSIIQQLKVENLHEFAREPYEVMVFTDLASGLVNEISTILKGKKVFILDHHEMSEGELPPNINIVNPHLHGIDGGKEISGAGVVYRFAEAVEPKMQDFAHIAIVGAIGDMQEQGKFEYLNDKILEIAVKRGKIKVKRGLRLFGAQTRPLYKALEYCTDPFIPGVSGSESGSIQFLQSCGISPKHEKAWKKVGHLTEEEMKNLVTGVIMRRLGETSPEDVLGNVYLLREEEEGSPTKDAKEFATLLNACGRLGKASIGIGACIGDEKDKQRALRVSTEYKRHIVNAMNWYNDHKESGVVEQGKGFMILNAGISILPTIIGTLASIISKGTEVKEGTYILSLAQLEDGFSKASIRIAGIREDPDVDLKQTIDKIVDGLPECEAGGHQHAAGAVFPTEHEEQFLKSARRVLGDLGKEEKVS